MPASGQSPVQQAYGQAPTQQTGGYAPSPAAPPPSYAGGWGSSQPPTTGASPAAQSAYQSGQQAHSSWRATGSSATPQLPSSGQAQSSPYPQTSQLPAYQSGVGSSSSYPGGYPTGQYGAIPPQGAAGASSTSGGKAGKVVLFTFLAILIALCGGVVGGLVVGQTGGSNGPDDGVSGGDVDRTGRNVSLADMAAKLQPSVVSVDVRTGNQQGTGSGVVISKDGLVLTNNHVAGDADEIEVTFHDGKSEDAKLVKADPDRDLAVIRIEGAKDLHPAKLGDSDKLRIGDTVVAIGSPLGLEGTVTAGIVSGLDRTIPEKESTGDDGREIRGVIQTDAAINPGNSGGPLLNVAGEVVGINTAIATMGEHGGNIGLGFAVPINSARDLIKEAGN